MKINYDVLGIVPMAHILCTRENISLEPSLSSCVFSYPMYDYLEHNKQKARACSTDYRILFDNITIKGDHHVFFNSTLKIDL